MTYSIGKSAKHGNINNQKNNDDFQSNSVGRHAKPLIGIV